MKMKKLFFRLFVISVGVLISVAVPKILENNGFYFISWIPAALACVYLEEVFG